MKSIAKWLLTVLLLPLLLLALVLCLALENTPKLQATADLTPEQIARGKQIFKQNDPRRLKSGSIVKVALNQEDLSLAINYLANQFAGGVANLRVDSDKARIEATLPLPANPLGRFLNLSLELKQTARLPTVDQLKLGKLLVPGLLAEPLIRYGIMALQPDADRQSFANFVKHVNFQPRRMIITYRWRADLPGKLRDVLLSPDDQQRIEAYQRRLAALNLENRNLSLTTLSKPLFKLAQERSANGDPIAENRALILVLTFYANRMALTPIAPQSGLWPRPLWRTVTLNGRDDLAKHYLVSAMLAAYSGTPLADAAGLFKEIEDSRGGSGFSFIDLAADRAGTRMGEQAVTNPTRARRIQTLMATADEKQILPASADLPESLPEDEFIRRYGGIDGEAYKQMMQDIESRIAILPAYRE